MQTTINSRQAILEAIRGNLPQQRVEHPAVPAFSWVRGPLKAAFVTRLEEAGGAAHEVASAAEANAKLMALYPEARVICSAVPEIMGTRRADSVTDRHELADVDVGMVRAEFAVAEGGAVWLTEKTWL